MNGYAEKRINEISKKTKLRCNLCGDYGAEWIHDERPNWGAPGNMALCHKHKAELIAEKERHAKEMERLRTINYEQDTRYKEYIK